MMDISPAFPRVMSKNMDAQTERMSGARLFGRDASNDNDNFLAPSPHLTAQGSMKSASTRDKRIGRSAIPAEWMSQVKNFDSLGTKKETNMFDVSGTIVLGPG